MPSNIEIKARVRDLSALRHNAAQLAMGPSRILHQEDVFFRTPHGRLKLRIFPDGSGQLIQYERPDTIHCKQSDYRIHETSDPASLRASLAAALGETITVTKKREVFLVGQTRVHLDEVEGLGSFMELEVVLRPDQDPEEGRSIATALMAKLGVRESDLVSCAYADLLAAERSADPSDDPGRGSRR